MLIGKFAFVHFEAVHDAEMEESEFDLLYTLSCNKNQKASSIAPDCFGPSHQTQGIPKCIKDSDKTRSSLWQVHNTVRNLRKGSETKPDTSASPRLRSRDQQSSNVPVRA